ncbi:MAG: hypothetical protein ACHBN1_35705 [Heteroscytonema crispum UTEX LB 1556]
MNIEHEILVAIGLGGTQLEYEPPAPPPKPLAINKEPNTIDTGVVRERQVKDKAYTNITTEAIG